MRTLAPLPDTFFRPLSDADFNRLKKQHPGLWADPNNQPCVICRDTKVLRVRAGKEIVEAACNCLDQWNIYIRLLHASIGPHYQRLSWDDVKTVPQQALLALLDYDEHSERKVRTGQGLVLHGPNGTGKSMLATLLLKKLMARGYDGYFTQFNEMLDAYTKGWRDEEENEWFIRRVCNAAVLVIDDVGKESKGRSNVTDPMFDRVIRHRVAFEKATIITTNYSMEDLQIGYGGSVMSLLSECSDYIHVPGIDFRHERLPQQIKSDDQDSIDRPLVLDQVFA